MYVTGFAKTHPNQLSYSLTLKLHSCSLLRHQAYWYRWPSLLSQLAFHQPCQAIKMHYRACGSNG